MKLKTYCGGKLWFGCFGADAEGNQHECNEVIEVELQEEDVEQDGLSFWPSNTINCPKCHRPLELPQVWEKKE